jgi:hypothetical protein
MPMLPASGRSPPTTISSSSGKRPTPHPHLQARESPARQATMRALKLSRLEALLGVLRVRRQSAHADTNAVVRVVRCSLTRHIARHGQNDGQAQAVGGVASAPCATLPGQERIPNCVQGPAPGSVWKMHPAQPPSTTLYSGMRLGERKVRSASATRAADRLGLSNRPDRTCQDFSCASCFLASAASLELGLIFNAVSNCWRASVVSPLLAYAIPR